MIDTDAGYPKMLMSIISVSYDVNRHFGMHPSDIIFVPGFEMAAECSADQKFPSPCSPDGLNFSIPIENFTPGFHK